MCFLTAQGGMLGPIAELFGYLMNYIYLALEKINFGNIGVAIIIFTLITRIILYPFTVKQQKSSKLMTVIQPEIQMIQAKYQGATDQASLMAQQAEIKEVYEKYGTSMTGSCVQLLVQMPIIFALYRVIMNVPAYVPVIKNKFLSMVDLMGSDTVKNIEDFIASDVKVEKMAKTIKDINILSTLQGEAQTNKIIDFLYKLSPEQFGSFVSKFENQEAIKSVYAYIENANKFLGLNLATSPSEKGMVSFYLLIPILAGLTQYISVLIMQKQTQNKMVNDEANQMNQTMKTMNVMMPLMSAVFCYGFATGIGIYWIASSLFMVISQVIINAHLNKMNIEEMIRKNIEKANAKRAKKGMPIINVEKAINDIKNRETRFEEVAKKREEVVKAQVKKSSDATDFYFKDEDSNSLFAKANMVQKYNEKHN